MSKRTPRTFVMLRNTDVRYLGARIQRGQLHPEDRVMAFKYLRVNAEGKLVSPIHHQWLLYEVGATLTVEDIDRNRARYCGAGINVASWEWVMCTLDLPFRVTTMSRSAPSGSVIRIEVASLVIPATAIIVVPRPRRGPDPGKFRVSVARVDRIGWSQIAPWCFQHLQGKEA